MVGALALLTALPVLAVGSKTYGIEAGDFDAVREDIRKLLPDENFVDGNHGPNFIRLAWHCAGSYRTSDGRGGCDGARIRYEPEKSWGGNKNLDSTLDYLTPIKLKYGRKLSWGDLIILAGNTAVEAGDGPTIPFCGGRKDDLDGFWSLPLDNEDIYVDAEKGSAQQVRDSFALMDMDDRETVALVAGGHAYGGAHADTSGFDGFWTSEPTMFSNEYVVNLLTKDWKPTKSPKGKLQYEADGLFMLHTDIVMKDDPIYRPILDEYFADESLLKAEFGAAWAKLTNRDMGPRPCLGEKVEPVDATAVDYPAVKSEIQSILHDDEADFGHYGGLFVRLAWHCAGTYRHTDHRGGCNGARIRHDPEFNWASNLHLDFALSLLEPIKERFGEALSWADLIILTGNTALEDLGSNPIPFCPGRTDEENGEGSKYLDPEIYLDAATANADLIKESMLIMGFDNQEMTVLNGGGHSIGQMHRDRSGFNGPWTHNPTQFSNEFFKLLLSETWIPRNDSVTGKPHYTDEATGTLTMLHTDVAFLRDPEFRKFVEDYASDEEYFKQDFVKAWTKLTNADRFGGVCDSFLGAPLPPVDDDCMEGCARQCTITKPVEGVDCTSFSIYDCKSHSHCRVKRNKCQMKPCKMIRDEVSCLTNPKCMPVYRNLGTFKKCGDSQA